jgi:DNA polymerase
VQNLERFIGIGWRVRFLINITRLKGELIYECISTPSRDNSMPNYVPGYGCSTAKLAIVGEAPSEFDEEVGRPFVGSAGNILDEILESARIDRSQVYITNVCKVRPPNNKIKDLHLIGHKLEEFIPQLQLELNELKPNVVLTFGNTALQTLTGNKGIEKYRGSILHSHMGTFKVIPSIHPAALFHSDGGEAMKSWKELVYIKHDVARAARESTFSEFRLPSRTLQIARSSGDLYRFLNEYNGKKFVSIDVETSKTTPVCIGLAFNNWHALSVPTLNKDIPIHDKVYTWKLLAEFLTDNKTKFIAQNGKFDEKRCRQIGLKWHDLYFDTMFAWHTLYAELPKKLAFITSIITDEPYYKDEYEEFGHGQIDKLFTYNARDAAVEFEVYEKLLAELNKDGMADFFFNRMMPLHRLYSDIEDVGILIDKDIRKHLNTKYNDKLKGKYETLINNIIDGDETMRDTFKKINCDSPKQIASLLYGYLGCPPRKDVKEDTLKALANNAIKDKRRKDIIQGIMECRKVRKSISTYINAGLSEGDRIRTECNTCGTESGRTTTNKRKPPTVVIPDGIALQTMTKHEDVTMDADGADLRSMFIADPGWILVEPDLSQAEDRVVCVLSKDWDALKDYEKTIFIKNKHGCKDDRHTKTAMGICSLRFEDVTDYDRQIGKKTRHAGNYDMGKHQGMLNCAKYGIFISEWKMGKYLEEFHSNNTKIKQVFHAEIQEMLASNDCTLYSPQGRKRQFFNKWGDELFKEAYSYVPQATISDQVKFAMLEIKKEMGKDILFQLESHDSFLALIRENEIAAAGKIIKKYFEKPINFSGCTLSRNYNLVIPCEIKIGHRWIEKSPEFSDGMEKYDIG